MHVTCPEYDKRLKVSEQAAGKKVRCPGCKTPIAVPEEAVRADPAPKPKEEPVALRKKRSAAAAADAAPARSTMRCAACKARALEPLPPNQFSRRPGYVCSECEAIMRPPGSTGLYVIAIVLSGLALLGGVGLAILAFSDSKAREKLFGAAGSAFGVAALVATWAVKQLRLPTPLDAPVRRSRPGFWIAFWVIGLLLIGGIVFAFAYFLKFGL